MLAANEVQANFQDDALDPIAGWSEIARLLPPDYGELATAHKQIQTQFGNAKITTADELLRFLFAYVQSNLPLRHTVAAIEAAGGPRLSAMRLHMKMRHAAPYLHALLGRVVPERDLFGSDAFRDLDFVAVEATEVVGPGSTCTPARLHAAMRLSDVCITGAVLTDRNERDASRRFAWSEGQVVLAREGEASPAAIARIAAQGALALITLEDSEEGATSLPLLGPDGNPFDVAEAIATARTDASCEWPAILRAEDDEGQVQLIEGRVVARIERRDGFGPESTGRYAVPSLLAEPARTPAALIFTTVPQATLTAEAVLDAHALAGRIARSTSGWRADAAGEPNRLSNHRDDTTLSWLYAKMLLGILARRRAARAA